MKSDSKTTIYEIMQSYCVRVNGGSGVLVNAMTKEYSYVLTAAHVIKDFLEHEVIDFQGNNLEVLGVLKYSEDYDPVTSLYDYAILKVSYQSYVEQKILAASDLLHRTDLTLVGCPTTERTSQDPIKFYDGHMTNVTNDLIIFTIDVIPGKPTISGMSGGGLYNIRDGLAFLVGVEFQMDSIDQDQQYGRVQCHSLVKFEEIIKIHECAPIIPAHLECFSILREKTFVFNVIDPNNTHNLKIALEKFADSLIIKEMPPPYEIMGQYDLQLLVDLNQTEELKSRDLWVAYLEYLVICALIDNVGITNADYIKSIERKRRLLYSSNSRNWISNLEELLKTARRLLDKDGTLIIASPDKAARLLPPNFELSRVINDISNVPDQGPFSIDTVETSIYNSFTLTHLEALHNCWVINSEFEYKALPSGIEQLRLFKDKLNEIIK